MFSTGHGEYSYQQSSYGEQGYDRPFDESSQHYYEGGNICVFDIFSCTFTTSVSPNVSNQDYSKALPHIINS